MSSIIKKSERTIYIPKGRRGKGAKKVVDCSMGTGDINNNESNNCSANNILIPTVEGISIKEEVSQSPKWERGLELYVPKGRRETKKIKESKVETDVISTMNGTDERNSSNGATSSSIPGDVPSESEKLPESSESASTTVSKRGRGFGLYVPKGRREKVAKNQKMEIEETNCCVVINSTNQESTSSIISNALTSLSISAAAGGEEEDCPQTCDTTTTTTTTALKRDKVVEIYIPKGRKLLNEQKQKEKSQSVPVESTGGTKKKGSSKKSGREDSETGCSEAATSAKKSCTEEKIYVPRSIKEDEFFYGKLSDDDLLLCCLVLRGAPADLNDGARSSCIDFFLQRGASATWRPSGECILVFRSESFLDSAINGWNIQVPNAVFRVQRFNSLIDNRDEVLLVGREAFSRGFKPIQRDITVANRFIGAALGVRVPQKPRSLPHNQQNRKTSNDHPDIDADAAAAAATTSTTSTSNPAVIIDAWDD